MVMDAYEYYSKFDDIGKDQSKFHELEVNYKIPSNCKRELD